MCFHLMPILKKIQGRGLEGLNQEHDLKVRTCVIYIGTIIVPHNHCAKDLHDESLATSKGLPLKVPA